MVEIKYVQIQETGPVENLGKRCSGQMCSTGSLQKISLSVTLSYQNENKARSELLSNYYLALLTSSIEVFKSTLFLNGVDIFSCLF